MPPRETADLSLSPPTPIVDTVCFTINFSIAVLFFVASVVPIGTADNPLAFLGGLVLVFPIAAYAVAEWVCWYRQRHWLYRHLGIVNWLFAAFWTFGLVTNIGEALMADEPVDPLFILIFNLGFAILAGYLGWCGWRRFRAIPSDLGTTHADE